MVGRGKNVGKGRGVCTLEIEGKENGEDKKDSSNNKLHHDGDSWLKEESPRCARRVHQWDQPQCAHQKKDSAEKRQLKHGVVGIPEKLRKESQIEDEHLRVCHVGEKGDTKRRAR